MTRNLVYVAMTRAMDQLSVFALEKPSSGVIQELLLKFDEYSGAKLPPFRAKVATHSGGWLPPIPGHGCHFSGV